VTATKNQAFLFVKPHAVTPATVALVKEGLAKAGITVMAEGSLDGSVIAEKLLIDAQGMTNKKSVRNFFFCIIPSGFLI
jgi:hypothetical protein